MRVRVIVGAVLTVAMVGACSSDTTTPAGASADASPAGTGSESAPPSDSGSPSGEPAADVILSNFLFSPDPITVTSGDTLSLLNSSTASSHTFTVPGQGIDVIVEVQSEGEAPIDLEPGTYEVICKFHETAGMVATLEVEPAAA